MPLHRQGVALKQTTFSTAGFDRYAKTTKRAAFLAEMEQVVPWSELCGLVEPFYPKGEAGRRPFGLERMLRIYCLQQRFNLSDPAAEEALYDSLSVRRFPYFGIIASQRVGQMEPRCDRACFGPYGAWYYPTHLQPISLLA